MELLAADAAETKMPDTPGSDVVPRKACKAGSSKEDDQNRGRPREGQIEGKGQKSEGMVSSQDDPLNIVDRHPEYNSRSKEFGTAFAVVAAVDCLESLFSRSTLGRMPDTRFEAEIVASPWHASILSSRWQTALEPTTMSTVAGDGRYQI